MTVNAIIEKLYKSNDLDNCIRKMVRPDHQADFKHELILLLYDKPQSLILSLYNTSGLTYYVVRIILNLVNQKRNVYHRTYNDYSVLYDTEIVSQVKREHEPVDIEKRLKEEEKEQRLINHIKNGLDEKDKFPYYRELVEAVERYGGIRKASKATGVPRNTISRAIKRVREKLNSIYNDKETIKGIY